MQPDSNPSNPVLPQTKTRSRPVLTVILVLVVAALSGTIGYFASDLLGNNDGGTSPLTGTSTKTTNSSQTNGAHLVTSVGFPFGTDRKLTMRLGVPGDLQAIKTSSSIQNPGYTGILTNKFDAEIGRWTLGRPTISDSGTGELSLIHIEDSWLNSATTNTAADEPFGPVFDPINFPSYNMTAAQKKEVIAKLKSDTEACRDDADRGIVIAKWLNVCTSPYQVKQAVGSYSPNVNIKGYGTVDDQNYVLIGSISLRDDSVLSQDEQTTLQNQFKENDLPPRTKAVYSSILNALKESTITSEKR